jgi:hypothetical protein
MAASAKDTAAAAAAAGTARLSHVVVVLATCDSSGLSSAPSIGNAKRSMRDAFALSCFTSSGFPIKKVSLVPSIYPCIFNELSPTYLDATTLIRRVC